MMQHLKPYADTDVPVEIDGSSGSNRASIGHQQIPLANDREAMGHFLEQYTGSPGTHRLYSRECERLALWALHVRQKPISSFNITDIEHYIDFLARPIPESVWCGPKAPRHSDAWRPFVGPVDVSAKLSALSAINSMLNYWVQAGYLNGNPMGLFRQLKQRIQANPDPCKDKGANKRSARAAVKVDEGTHRVERYLDDDMWRAVMCAVEAMAPQGCNESMTAEYERARFVMAFLYLMAPRVGELETHNMNSFREIDGRWWWFVVGKGAKLAKVPAPDDMLQALIRYRKHLGMSAVPTSKDDSPLLRSTRHPGASISARRINQVLKQIFESATTFLPQEVAHKAEKLLLASAHWGRHTSISSKINSGMNHLHVQRDARHADFRTTQLYIHDADIARHDDAQKQQLNWSETP